VAFQATFFRECCLRRRQCRRTEYTNHPCECSPAVDRPHSPPERRERSN
jgi:hypothetical protein